ncbi:MAG TPA: penicillin acylase family protein [Cyclobacteriaceae bacterium]
MKVAKVSFSALITISLIYLLNSSWVIGGNRLPPLGKFLDPFHGFWQNMEPANKTGEQELSIPGLKAKVTVVYDSILIPHIFAQNDEDLYLAQGYVTAMHRLWQMEFQTHAAAGRVSEITGPGKNGLILNFDRGQRRLGMSFGAEHVLKAVMSDPLSRLMTEKYSEGINQYIQSLNYDDLPFEYKLLDYDPEPWAPIKCALLLKNMAQTLDMGDKDIEMTNALKLFGKDMVDILYPDMEPVGDPIVDNPGGWKFNPVKIDSIPMALPDELIHTKKLPGEDPTTGSNNWAVSGSKTVTGSPMLCGDPHLNLSLPSIWYAVQLNAPGINAMGASLPGAPAIIIGFNDSIAWSVTNAQRDLVDWYAIKYQQSNRDNYLLDEKWIPTKKQIEKFKVRGESVFYDTVIYTTWGPVTYDRNYHAEDNLKDYAFRWLAHDESNEFITFYLLNRGKNHDDYMQALNHFSAPAQNFVFASVSGDVAMRIQGKYPVRRKDEGKFVLDGSKSSMGWKAFIPNEQNVMYKNPARGFVSSANQYPVDATYPYYVTATHFEAYRNRRINQVLGESNKIDVAYLMKLQNDNYNLKAAESLPVFLSYVDSTSLNAEEKQAYQKLKAWDYYNNVNSEGASYYEAWWDNLMPLLWDEMNNPNTTLYTPTTFNTIHLIKTKPDFNFFDVQKTSEKETAKEVIQQAFKLGVAEVVKWKKDHTSETVDWADYKDSYVGHLLRIDPLSIHVKHGGNHDIVNANSKTHGPSWRMIVSLEKSGVKCWATYPGGQSGNPGSEHYADMLNKWVNGQYYSILFMHSPTDDAGKIFYSTQLNASSK